MADVILHEPAIEEFLHRTGIYAAGLLADAVVERAKPLTPPMTTRPPSAKQGGDFGPYSGPPGALEQSIMARGGHTSTAFYALARKPVGWFRNLSGKGEAAYQQGAGPGGFRTTGGRRRKQRAARGSYGHARGDWRSVGRAVESTNGAIITRAGVG